MKELVARMLQELELDTSGNLRHDVMQLVTTVGIEFTTLKESTVDLAEQILGIPREEHYHHAAPAAGAEDAAPNRSGQGDEGGDASLEQAGKRTAIDLTESLRLQTEDALANPRTRRIVVGFLPRNPATLVTNSWRLARNQQTTRVKCDNGMGSSPTRAHITTDVLICGLVIQLPNLTWIDFTNCWNITDVAVITLARLCRSLRSVNLSYCRDITDDAVIALATHSKSLESVNLCYCSCITDDSLFALATNSLSITSMNLRGCYLITEHAVVAYATYFPKLTCVDLSNTADITDNAVVALAKHCPSLTVLDLNNCGGITDTAACVLAQCPILAKVVISGCFNLTEDFRSKLLASRPGIRIEYNYTGIRCETPPLDVCP